jgi:hypothetical protein
MEEKLTECSIQNFYYDMELCLNCEQLIFHANFDAADNVLVNNGSTGQTLYMNSQPAVNTKYYQPDKGQFILSNIQWQS